MIGSLLNLRGARDTSPPVMTISTIADDPVTISSFQVTFYVNRGPVVGFTAADVTLVNNTLSDFTAVSTNLFTATCNPTASGAFSISVAASKFTVDGIDNSASNVISKTYTPAPEIVTAPVISGTPSVGSTLSTTNGSWSPSPASYSYQWKRSGDNIASATSSTYVITSDDVWSDITCVVTAYSGTGSNNSSESNSIGVVDIDSITDMLGASDFWIDGTYSTNITSTTGTLGCVVDALTTRDPNAYTSSPLVSGGLQYKPRFNGEGLYLNGTYGFTLGNNTKFKSLHDGTPYILYIVFKQLPMADSSSTYALLRTAVTSSNIGLRVDYYNRASASAAKTLFITINNGSGGTAQFAITGTQNCIVDNEYHTLKLKLASGTLTAYVKQRGGSYTQIGQDSSGSFSSSNSTSALGIGLNSGAWSGYLAQALLKTNHTTDNESDLDAWSDYAMDQGITETPVNVYLSGPAQSNFWGKARNATIASDLSGNCRGRVWFHVNNSSMLTNGLPYWTEMVTGVSSNPDSGETFHGFLNRFGLNMYNDGKTPYILAFGVQSTYLKQQASVSDWNAASVGKYFDRWKNTLITKGLSDLKHVMRKTPVFRGMIVMQGENDAVTDGSTYQADLEAWIKGAVDYLISVGYDTTKMRVWVFRIANLYSAFTEPSLTQVRAAQQAIGSNSSPTDFSLYIPAKFKGITWYDTDGLTFESGNLHYDSPGVDTMGVALYDYYKAYFNE